MEGLLNLIRREVNRSLSLVARDRIGIVDSYDPDHHAVKVRFQPQDTLSGWIPVGAAMAGNGFGVLMAPNVGDQVMVHPIDGFHEARIAGPRLFSTTDQPPAVPAGEMWVVHKSGSLLKFHNDGTVELTSNDDFTWNVGGNLAVNVSGSATVSVSGNLSATANEFDLTGDVAVTGALTTTDDVTASGSISLTNHVHGGVQSGASDTAPPTG